MNIENPIQFLEIIAEGDFINTYWDSFIKEYSKKVEDGNKNVNFPSSFKINLEKYELIIDNQITINSEIVGNLETISFKNEYLPKQIEFEVKKSKNQINLIFVNNERAERVLNNLLIQILTLKSKWIEKNLKDYDFIDTAVEDLLEYIRRYLPKQINENLIERAEKTIANDLEPNNFNEMPLTEVKEHFMQLKTLKGKNGKPYLKEEELNKFLKIAFKEYNKESPPTEKIKIEYNDGEKGNIIKIFYSFFDKSKIAYEPTQNVKEKYVKLLTDYFQGFDFVKVSNNFNKYKSP